MDWLSVIFGLALGGALVAFGWWLGFRLGHMEGEESGYDTGHADGFQRRTAGAGHGGDRTDRTDRRGPPVSGTDRPRILDARTG